MTASASGPLQGARIVITRPARQAAGLAQQIAALGAQVSLRGAGTPFVTDEGHHILDCTFGEISNPAGLAERLRAIPGVVEHGLFIGMAEMALIGKDGGVVQIRR